MESCTCACWSMKPGATPFRVEHDARLIGFDPVGVDAHDAISADRDIGREALGAGTVHDGAVLDNDVVSRLGGEEKR